jgi:hypothetical protein
MPNETKQDEALSPEIQDVIRQLVTAIRAVKIYPPNNPVYSQSVKKAYDVLARFLESAPDFTVGVQKTQFTYQNQTMGKDAQLNKAIAQDLFAKGIREIIFSAGMTQAEFLCLCQGFALSSEDLAMKSGISSILWEMGAQNIKVTEAGLDEVVTTQGVGNWAGKPAEETAADAAGQAEKNKSSAPPKTLVLGDLMTDPSGFGASMVEMAKMTRADHETIEDRLYTLYQEAGRKIQETRSGESDSMFEGLAKSVLSLETAYRDGLIAGKLYGDLDAEIAGESEDGADQQLPSAVHEVQTGRFSNSWTVQQVATLLKRSASKEAVSSAPPPTPDTVPATPVPEDLAQMAKTLAEYTPEEMAELKDLGDSGMESDIIEAAVRTLIALIPLVKDPKLTGPTEKDLVHFSGVVHQLEDLLGYLYKKKEYERAGRIVAALHQPVDPAFRPRMMEALKKVASKSIIVAAIADLRKHHKDDPEYQSAYAYVSGLDRDTTEVLLEFLAEEKDRAARLFYLELVRDIGKNQFALYGERLSDSRWYFVRNIVNLLSDVKTDQSIALLRKAADHESIQVRQEVIKALLSIGGKKASGVLAKLLRDKDESIQKTAIHAFAAFPEIGAEEAKPLIAFLEDRRLNKREQQLTVEAIKALGKTGGKEAAEFLKRYAKVTWWKSRKLQDELRVAAHRATDEIGKRRKTDGGSAAR